ncbi:sorbitol dehydrogenase [Diaporthe helianthi]|uniref:Sorbitol dehydrogenase n=1 Tax=Diaporthe helianthi TaxID=158607 RepID=A0A2P5HWI5_DIAHE|nr:sorbitol dehydrogenase [Diaporthe helianthi]
MSATTTAGSEKRRAKLSTLRHNQSTLQDLVEHAACWVCRLLAELSFEPGALLVPLAVAIRVALREARKTV